MDDALYFDNPTATNNDGSFLYCADTDPRSGGLEGLTFEVISLIHPPSVSVFCCQNPEGTEVKTVTNW